MRKPIFCFFDTETSGFASDKLEATHKDQAWICQFAAILRSADKTYAEMNFLLESNGRLINPHAQKVHGWTIEECDEHGVRWETASMMIAALFNRANSLVCHNYAFDAKMVKLLAQSSNCKSLEVALSVAPFRCTMQDSTNLCNIINKFGKPKWPKLEELYRHLYGTDFENAHDAMADVRATADCFFHPQFLEFTGIDVHSPV